MVRDYTEDPVDAAVVDRALAAAVRAPNAGFTQGWGFLVLDTPTDVRRYWDATAGRVDEPDTWLRGMMRAPVVVVPCSSKQAYLDRYAEPDKGWTDRDEARWPVPYWHTDAAMAALLILQTAVDEGLGACFFGVPPDRVAPCAPPSASLPASTRSARSPSATRPPRPAPPARRDGVRAGTSPRWCTVAGGAIRRDMGPVQRIATSGASRRVREASQI